MEFQKWGDPDQRMLGELGAVFPDVHVKIIVPDEELPGHEMHALSGVENNLEVLALQNIENKERRVFIREVHLFPVVTMPLH